MPQSRLEEQSATDGYPLTPFQMDAFKNPKQCIEWEAEGIFFDPQVSTAEDNKVESHLNNHDSTLSLASTMVDDNASNSTENAVNASKSINPSDVSDEGSALKEATATETHETFVKTILQSLIDHPLAGSDDAINATPETSIEEDAKETHETFVKTILQGLIDHPLAGSEDIVSAKSDVLVDTPLEPTQNPWFTEVLAEAPALLMSQKQMDKLGVVFFEILDENPWVQEEKKKEITTMSAEECDAWASAILKFLDENPIVVEQFAEAGDAEDSAVGFAEAAQSEHVTAAPPCVFDAIKSKDYGRADVNETMLQSSTRPAESLNHVEIPAPAMNTISETQDRFHAMRPTTTELVVAPFITDNGPSATVSLEVVRPAVPQQISALPAVETTTNDIDVATETQSLKDAFKPEASTESLMATFETGDALTFRQQQVSAATKIEPPARELTNPVETQLLMDAFNPSTATESFITAFESSDDTLVTEIQVLGGKEESVVVPVKMTAIHPAAVTKSLVAAFSNIEAPIPTDIEVLLQVEVEPPTDNINSAVKTESLMVPFQLADEMESLSTAFGTCGIFLTPADLECLQQENPSVVSSELEHETADFDVDSLETQQILADFYSPSTSNFDTPTLNLLMHQQQVSKVENGSYRDAINSILGTQEVLVPFNLTTRIEGFYADVIEAELSGFSLSTTASDDLLADGLMLEDLVDQFSEESNQVDEQKDAFRSSATAEASPDSFKVTPHDAFMLSEATFAALADVMNMRDDKAETPVVDAIVDCQAEKKKDAEFSEKKAESVSARGVPVTTANGESKREEPVTMVKTEDKGIKEKAALSACEEELAAELETNLVRTIQVLKAKLESLRELLQSKTNIEAPRAKL
ncbi:hypothetical protein HDV05_001027 [Chytridiales sp. JEL 0842]|nr:hypothetical protein HDV05_001027 [Chytridiales sp. JEL 0842]